MSVRDALVRPGRQRQLLTVTLMTAMGVVALEGTVVTTALPTIVGELQGVSLYPWVFSVYLLTSTTSAPIYGKLADIYGRKPVFLAGLSLFLLGTVLCGASASMLQLVAYRAVQGVGAGAVLPLTLTVLSDIYSLPERARVQPLTSSVWGVLSLVGPAAGAFITETLSWRWVFWVNIPVCLLTLALLQRFLRERVTRRAATIDYAGTATLSLGLVALLLVVLGGREVAWGSWQSVALLVAAGALFLAFALIERRAADPVLPFGAFRLRIVAVSNTGNVLIGVCLFGLTSYVPLFAQGVRGETSAGASAVLTPLLLGWSLAALLSGRLYVRTGFRATALAGTGLIAAGTAPLALLGPDTPLILASVPMGVTGIGLGIASPAFLLGPQSAVPWNMRGAVTSSTQFCRSIGGAVGVALLGALLNAQLRSAGVDRLAQAAGKDVESLVSATLNVAARASLPPQVVAELSLALAGGLQRVYFAIFSLAVLGLVQVALFSRSGEARRSQQPHPITPGRTGTAGAAASPTAAGG